MKKVVLGLIALLSFTACNKNDFDYNPQEAVTAKYNDAFIKTFGTPAANHTWGFNAIVTRSVIKENHELPSGYAKPTLDDGEAEYVMNWFATNEGEASKG